MNMALIWCRCLPPPTMWEGLPGCRSPGIRNPIMDIRLRGFSRRQPVPPTFTKWGIIWEVITAGISEATPRRKVEGFFVTQPAGVGEAQNVGCKPGELFCNTGAVPDPGKRGSIKSYRRGGTERGEGAA